MSNKFNRRLNKKIKKSRDKIINDIHVYEYSYNIRWILDDALRYYNMASDDTLEYSERDIKHIMVNDIRHNRSSYESGLKDINKLSRRLSRKDRQINYHAYKNATLDQISEAYPFLSKECKQQKYKCKNE